MNMAAAVTQKSVDLYNVRKSVRKIRNFLGIESNNEDLQKYPIRRKPLPPGYCYICSRLDPDGRYRQPYEQQYLYNKGFFSHCEHQPRVPYPSFVEEDKDNEFQHALERVVYQKDSTDPDCNLSVQVTVKPPKWGQHEQQGKYAKRYFDKSVLNGVPPPDEDLEDPAKYKLPPVFDPNKKVLDVDAGKHIPIVGDNTFEEALYASSGDLEVDNVLPDNTMGVFINETPAGEIQLPPLVIPTGEHLSSDQHTGRENSDEMKQKEFSSVTERKRVRGRTKRRPGSEVFEDHSAAVQNEDRDYVDDDSAHLKYHHRNQYDSVPQDGFEIAPSRDTTRNSIHMDGDILTANKISVSRKTSGKSEKSFSKSPDFKGHHHDKTKETPSMVIQRINESGHWCECHDIDHELSYVKCSECLNVGGHEKWCVHATSESKVGLCAKCGKPIKRRKKSRRHSKASKSEDFEFSSQKSMEGGSAVSSKEEPRVRFEDSQVNRTRGKRGNDPRRAKSENFMNYDEEDSELIAVKNKRAWSPANADDDMGKATPFPTLDQNIHRNAYSKAIEARQTELLKKIRHIDENYIADRLSKPHVFSYFKLRPQSLPGGPDNIGLFPPKSKTVTPKKAMAHIFGKLKVDDFYPGGKRNPRPSSEVMISTTKERNKQTMPVHTWKQDR